MKTLFLAALLLAGAALAGPGAHGPNGEHLDAPVQPGAAPAAPKLEARSELFELVATLSGGELSMLIDRFETNEPVLDAQVEVASGPLKAVARFHADHGDYAIDDAAFVQALGRPGEHALVFTVTAAGESDLLDGTLRTAAAAPADDHGHDVLTPARVATAGGVLLLAGSALAVALRRRRPQGGPQ